jgi:hypothetical protein
MGGSQRKAVGKLGLLITSVTPASPSDLALRHLYSQRHDRVFWQPFGSRSFVLCCARNDVHVKDIRQLAQAAIAAGDWDALRPLLHPYLHWTDSNGKTLRGRSNVLAMLAQAAQPPASAQFIELRDGQIYRWRA